MNWNCILKWCSDLWCFRICSPDRDKMPLEVKAILNAYALGFQPKPKSQTMEKLNNYRPSGKGRAIRDVVAKTMINMIIL